LDPPIYAPSNPAAYSNWKNERSTLTHNPRIVQYGECVKAVLDAEGVPDNDSGYKNT